jgi:hypothetical protein
MRSFFKGGLLVVLCLALWPALVGAQPPDPKGKLVYEDDFSTATKSGLEDNLRATDYSRGFHPPGVYHLILLKNNDTRWALLPNKSFGDFTLDLEVVDNSDDFVGDFGGGVVVRAQDDTHLYAVMLNTRKGQYTARKLNGTTWTDLIAWKASPLIKQRDAANQLRVDAAGNTFTIYLNGEQLDTFSDSSYTKGQVGMIATNVDAAKPHMHFDNLKLYTAEAQPAAPAGGPAAALPGTGGVDLTALLIGCALALLGLGLGLRSLERWRVR